MADGKGKMAGGKGKMADGGWLEILRPSVICHLPFAMLDTIVRSTVPYYVGARSPRGRGWAIRPANSGRALGSELTRYRQAGGSCCVVVEVLIKVGLAVSVEVVEPDDLVAAADVDLAPDDLQAQRLEQARGDPPPGEPLLRSIDALDEPDVAVPGADRRSRPSGRKSKPESRNWQSHGLLSGTVRTSTAKGPSSRPIVAGAGSRSGQRAGRLW